jgi:hypothetical protein
MADLGAVGGKPPRTAAVGRGKPHVVFRDERQELTVNMRIPKITS